MNEKLELNKPLDIVIYNRCYTEELAQVDALEIQVQFSREYCEQRGWMVLKQFIEPKSGTCSDNRLQYKRLCDSLYPNRISATWWRSNCILNPRMHETIVMHTHSKDFWTKQNNKVPADELVYYDNALTAIVSKEYQEETIELLKRRYYKPKNKDISLIGKHTYSNKIKCATCNEYFYRYSSKSKNNSYVFWRCSRAMQSGHKGYNSLTLQESILDSLIEEACKNKFDNLFNFSLTSNVIDETIKVLKNTFNNNSLDKRIQSLESELNKQTRKKNVLFDKLTDGIIDDLDFKKYNDELKISINSLSDEIIELKSKIGAYNNYEDRLNEIRDKLIHGYEVKESISLELKNSISEIVVEHSGEVTVYFDINKIKILHDINSIIGYNINKLNSVKFKYVKETVYELNRKQMNIEIIKLFIKNNKYTIQQCADELNAKYSYIYN